MTTASPPRRTDPGAITRSEVRRPASLADAIRELAELGTDGAPLAGGTWVMRAPLRGAPVARVYVALDGLAELHGIRTGDDAVEIGAMVTHDELAALDAPPALAGLIEAARRSAFPAVRSVATVGGNIAAVGFPEADLVPALLAAEARVVVAGPDGERTEDLAGHLASRRERLAGELIARIVVPTPAARRSAFERLTVRGGGEYAIASVALSVDIEGATVAAARVGVGGVEEIARLSDAAAAVLVGAALDDAAAERAGQAAADECTAREGLDAPGWYRLAVLPALARRAAATLTTADDQQK
ncbi:FAD binding domain-containing protein [Pseudonocardia acidicola]|uniref:FAD-binding molybdopterin dehydrogenase n=1 Tax=Pseudonocardia acidicola TaxID=2724939 RepID=A0ABX1SA88_9PSEU|nr:FAD binding domain-containing protein [Pseudonocardia acidicola]NMH97482.1 FAD-binding molybdopterin dehydrogenase [Pseudonocardia acidicola]